MYAIFYNDDGTVWHQTEKAADRSFNPGMDRKGNALVPNTGFYCQDIMYSPTSEYKVSFTVVRIAGRKPTTEKYNHVIDPGTKIAATKPASAPASQPAPAAGLDFALAGIMTTLAALNTRIDKIDKALK